MTRYHESSDQPASASRTFARGAWSGAPLPWFAAGWVLHVLAACAVVMTGHMLGVSWLQEPSLGIPTGLWIVLITGLASHAASRRREVAPAAFNADFAPLDSIVPIRPEELSARPVAPTAAGTPTQPSPGGHADAASTTPPARQSPLPRRAATIKATWPADIVRSSGLTILSKTARTFEGPGGTHGSVSDALARRLDERGAPTRALRVGIMLDEWHAGRLADDSICDVNWIRASGTSPSLAMITDNLDAIVTHAGEDAPESLLVRTREHAAREAGWFDWGTPRPMTYFSIFPLRLDASRVTLPGMLRSLGEGETPALSVARRVIRLAALMSRSPGRLTLADRLSGRTAVVRGSRPDLTGDAIREATELLGETGTAAERAAARVASAWIATESDLLGDAERCRLAGLVAQAAGDEPEVMLRVAAVRLALLDEHLGIDAIARADRMIRQRGTLGGLDHLKLLQAELEHGTFGDMTLGRVAAGICLACAATPADRIAFLKDDLLEDFRFSHYLIGRDKEHAILMEVFRELERNRRAETFGLPSALAA